MARKEFTSVASIVTSFIRNLFSSATQRDRRNQRARRMGFESLETRQVMASDFGAISGLVYQDTTGNGFTLGEQVASATVELYSDDGNNVFNPGTGDNLLQTATTDVNGRYRFDNLTAGDYWVRQISQTVGSVSLSNTVSSRITITPSNAQGTAGVTIDDFNDTVAQSINAAFPVGSIGSSTALNTGSIGGERDMSVQLTSGIAGENVSMDSQAARLRFQSSDLAQGTFDVSWDGVDGDASTLNATGLGGIDLTLGGAATAFETTISADQPNGTARVRVYSSATNWSESTIFTIPGTNTLTNHTFRFADFTVGGGTGADFTNVGAITMEIIGTTDGMDGRVTLLRTLGATTLTNDFSNFADLSLTKTVDVATPTVGDTVTFQLTVSNAGPGNANGVQVKDLLPAGLSFVSSTASSGSYNSTTGVWTVGSVAVNGSQTLSIVTTMTGSSVVMNSAEITASNNFDPDSTPNNNISTEDDQAAVTVTPQLIDLSVTKAFDTGSSALTNVGQNVTFVVTVTNSNASGISTATGVQVTDLLPSGLTYVSSTTSGATTYNSGTGIWNVGTLAAGASATLHVTATVTSLGTKTNTAQVSAADQADIDSTPANNVSTEDDQASLAVTPPQIDLSVTKTATSSGNPSPSSALTVNKNEAVTFTITVTNSNASGIATATGVAITDLLPAGLTIQGTPAVTQGTYVSGTGVWTVGTLAPGATASLSIVAIANSTTVATNTAQVTAADQGDIDSTPNNSVGTEDDQASVVVTPRVTDIALTKTVDDNTPNKNQQVTFTLTATNQSAVNATGVQVTDLLPSGFTFVSATPSGTGTYNSTTGVWDIGALAAGGNATLTLVATVTASTATSNTAQVTATDQFDSDSTPGNSVATEDDQATVTLTPNVADLSVTKVASTTTPNRNQVVTFTVVVSNAGPASATGVQLTDLLPSGLTISGTPTLSQGTYNAGTGVWTVGTIANGSSATMNISATVVGSSTIVNVAEVTAADGFDPDSTPNNGVTTEDDRASVTLTPQVADVALTKTIDNSAPALNNNVVYTVTLINQGTIAATGLQVTDLLPSGVSFVSYTSSGSTSYNASNGIWNIGTVAVGQSATLTITAMVTSATTVTNTAQVTAMNEFDIDSTPGNSVATEDDQASVSFNAFQVLSQRPCRRRQ
ncbi:MAG: SpaA isopeptide-forming pilin-related protein [Planctomycetaceae bacterium]